MQDEIKQSEQVEEIELRVVEDPLANFEQKPDCVGVLNNSDFAIGQVVAGNYRLEQVIGHGGLGVVFKAKHLLLNRFVAIKFLQTDKINDGKTLIRFQREAKCALSLNHENIASVQEFGVFNGMPFIVMEYIEGESLAAILKSGPLDSRRALALTKQLMQGLMHAHERNLIHRDIKPSNIIVTKYGTTNERLKIIDFGLVRSIDREEDKDLTKTGEIIGTPNYMSPEQCRGQRLDGRSDLYSAGCVAFELIAGHTPFSGSSSVEVLLQHIGKPAPEIESPIEFPGFEKVVARCLAKDPPARYPTAKAVLEELDLLELGEKPKKTFFVEKRDLTRKVTYGLASGLAVSVIVVLTGTLVMNNLDTDSISSLNEKISRDSKNSDLYFRRAQLLNRTGSSDSALQDLKLSVNLNPSNLKYRTELVKQLLEARDFSTALKESKIAIRNAPENSEAMTGKALAELRLGNYKQALDDASKALQLIEKKPIRAQIETNANLVKSEASMQAGLFEQALDSAAKAASISASSNDEKRGILCSAAYRLQAEALLNLKKTSEALAAAEKSLEYDPNNYLALSAKARGLSETGSLDEALKTIDEAILLAPADNQLEAQKEQILLHKAR